MEIDERGLIRERVLLTEKEVTEVMRIEGKVRTATLKTDASSIIRLEGREGLL